MGEQGGGAHGGPLTKVARKKMKGTAKKNKIEEDRLIGLRPMDARDLCLAGDQALNWFSGAVLY